MIEYRGYEIRHVKARGRTWFEIKKDGRWVDSATTEDGAKKYIDAFVRPAPISVTNNDSRKRQSDYRRRMQDAGLVQVTGWVFSHQAGGVQDALRLLKSDPDLEPGPLRNTATGKLRSIRS